MTSSPIEVHNETWRAWSRDAVLLHKDGKLWMSASALDGYWEQLQPFLQMQSQLESALRPNASPADELKRFG